MSDPKFKICVFSILAVFFFFFFGGGGGVRNQAFIQFYNSSFQTFCFWQVKKFIINFIQFCNSSYSFFFFFLNITLGGNSNLLVGEKVLDALNKQIEFGLIPLKFVKLELQI